jgi:nucleotide-binding universal stress UspA family protein
MYDRILVPVDGSRFSEEVIPYARGIARSTGARLTLLRVVDKDGKRVEAQRYLEALAAEFDAAAATITSGGDVSADILTEADRVPGTLVAITSHGRGGVLSVMLGSVARDLVRSGHAPVFVYRPGGAPDGQHEPIQIRTVLLPLDGSSLSESAQGEAAAWARALHANVVVVQVLPSNMRIDPMLASYDVLEDSYVRWHARSIERDYGVEADWEVLHGDPTVSISNYLEGRRDVLVVMATRGHPALQSAVLGSVTSGLLRQAGAPIVVQAPERVSLRRSA